MEEQAKQKENIVNMDDVLGEIGKFGTFHCLQYLWIGLPIAFTAIMNANFIFAAADIDYRCMIPECEWSTSTNDEFIPGWWPNGTDYRCSGLLLNPGFKGTFPKFCSREMFSNITSSCDDWIYSSQDSIVATYELACKPWKRTLVGTIHNVGMLVSMPLFGYVSDKFGRKISLITSAVGGGGLGLLKTFAPNYSTYLTFEFLEAAFGAAAYTSTFVMLVELGGKDRTVKSAAYVGFFIAVGEITLALVAQEFPYWKTLIRITYMPTLLFIFYIFLLSESIRWLLVNGRRKEAKHILLKAAQWNKVQISKDTLAYLDTIEVSKAENDSDRKGIQIKDLISSPVIIQRVAISSFWWLSAAFIYYGLMINSVGLPGNKYINFILSSAISFPGDLISMCTLDVFGRKKTLMIAYLFCGVCCIASGQVPESIWWLRLAVFLLGKMAIAACFNGIYIYTSELFPTRMRSSLFGCCSMFARIGSILAPQTPLLALIMPSLPSILFGGFALTAGLLMLLTPETYGRRLPDTVQQAEQLGSAAGSSGRPPRAPAAPTAVSTHGGSTG